MLIVTNPYVMTQVLGILVLVVLPSLYFGRRVRKLSRASQDRVADSSAIAAEVLNAIPVVQSYVQEGARRQRFDASTESAFDTARKRTRVRAASWSASSSPPPSARCCGACTRARRR
jgi:ATP-binding cassette subfamily B protein